MKRDDQLGIQSSAANVSACGRGRGFVAVDEAAMVAGTNTHKRMGVIMVVIMEATMNLKLPIPFKLEV